MVRFSRLTYSLPSVEKFKQLLYDNDIGYKVVDGKLYVRRFYMIPQILFPKETFDRTSKALESTAGGGVDVYEDYVKEMKGYVPPQGIRTPGNASDSEDLEDDFGVQSIALAKQTVPKETQLVELPGWDSLLDKHNIKLPVTELEREREALFRSDDSMRLEDSTDEVDLYQFRRTRCD